MPSEPLNLGQRYTRLLIEDLQYLYFYERHTLSRNDKHVCCTAARDRDEESLKVETGLKADLR